jgi:hypothetical protein
MSTRPHRPGAHSTEAADAREDAEYGKGRSGEELPEDLRHAETRLARIKQLKAELEAEARQQAEEAAKHDDDLPPPPAETPLSSHEIPRPKDGDIDPKAQRNFTDPESRIMKSSEGYVQARSQTISWRTQAASPRRTCAR